MLGPLWARQRCWHIVGCNWKEWLLSGELSFCPPYSLQMALRSISEAESLLSTVSVYYRSGIWPYFRVWEEDLSAFQIHFPFFMCLLMHFRTSLKRNHWIPWHLQFATRQFLPLNIWGRLFSAIFPGTVMTSYLLIHECQVGSRVWLTCCSPAELSFLRVRMCPFGGLCLKDTRLEIVGHAVQWRRVQMGREVSG